MYGQNLWRKGYVLFCSILFTILFVTHSNARITPLAFKGITHYFQPGKEFYSPVIGAAALEAGLIYNLRFYGNFTTSYKVDEKGQPQRHYISDKSNNDPLWSLLKTLFPSSGGDLTTQTNSQENFGKHIISPRTIALLLYYAHQQRSGGEQKEPVKVMAKTGGKAKDLQKNSKVNDPSTAVADAIFQSLYIVEKTSQTQQANSYTMVSNLKKHIKTLLKTIDDSIKAEKSSSYPLYTTEQIILAFLCEKFDTRDDLIEFLSTLAEFDTAHVLMKQDANLLLAGKEVRYDRLNGAYLAFQAEQEARAKAKILLEGQTKIDQNARIKLEELIATAPILKVSKADQSHLSQAQEARAENSSIHPLRKDLWTEDLIKDIANKENLDVDDFYAYAHGDIFTQSIPYKSGEAPLSNGPTQVYDRSMGMLLTPTFADCAEITLRHVLNLMVFDPLSRTFNLESLKSAVNQKDNQNLSQYLLELENFYQSQHPFMANAGSIAIRSLWSRVIGDLNALDRGIPLKILYVHNQDHPEYELDTGFFNAINVFRKLFGFDLPEGHPTRNLNLTTASLDQKKYWINIHLTEFFKFINPHRLYEINTDRLIAGEQQGQPEMFGLVDVTVKSRQGGNSFSFTIKQLPGHGELINLQTNKANQKSESLVLDPKIFPSNTSLRTLKLLFPTQQQVDETFYQLYSHPLYDNPARLEALKKFLENLENKQSFEHLLIHILENTSWDDELTVAHATPVLLNLYPLFPKAIGTHTKALRINEKWGQGDFENLQNFHGLEFLNASFTEFLQQLSLVGLNNLKELNIEYSGVQQLPGLENCSKLETLKAHGVENLPQLPLRGLINLKSLDISQSQIQELPGLEACAALEVLDVSRTKEIQRLPLNGLRNLKNLRMKTSTVQEVPGLEECIALETLNVFESSFRQLSLSGLINLKELDINESAIESLTDLQECTSLEKLSAVATKNLSRLPLTGLVNLKELDISSSPIQELPGIQECRSLGRVKASGARHLNQLILTGLRNIRFIDVSNSGVKEMVDLQDCKDIQFLIAPKTPNLHHLSLWGFTKLKYLEIDGSAIAQVPGIEDCKALETMMITGSGALKQLPIAGLSKLEEIHMPFDYDQNNLLGFDTMSPQPRIKYTMGDW